MADTRSSSSSSLSSSSSNKMSGQATSSRRPHETDAAEVNLSKLNAYTMMNKFRITPTAATQHGGSGGEFGGFSGSCPFHRQNATTTCKRWSPLMGPTNKHSKEALTRLIIWLLAAPDHDRQRSHMAVPLQMDVSSVSTSDLHRQVQAINLPTERVQDGRTLDEGAGLNPDDAPRRAGAKRRTR